MRLIGSSDIIDHLALNAVKQHWMRRAVGEEQKR